MMNRRDFLKIALAGAAVSAGAFYLPSAFAEDKIRIAFAGRTKGGYKTGLLSINSGIASSDIKLFDLPSRAHDILSYGNGWIIIERIPGDWIAFYDQNKGLQIKVDIEDKLRAFGGHLARSHDGRFVYTTEFVRATYETFIGIRDIRTLKKVGEFRTGFTDPHSLTVDEDGLVYVANGGIPKNIDPEKFDTSNYDVNSVISVTNVITGKNVHEYSMPDKKLSMRHVAVGKINGQKYIGASLKSCYGTEDERRNKPVIAIIKDDKVQPLYNSEMLGGYAGDVGFIDNKFYVSCTLSNKVISVDPLTMKRVDTLDVFESCAIRKHPTKDTMFLAGSRDFKDNNSLDIGFNKASMNQFIYIENHFDYIA